MIKELSRPTEMGLYCHIPFCSSKCPYCDFNSYIYNPVLARDYFDAMKSEISCWGRTLGRPRLKSVYFGGGTPTTLSAAQLAALLRLAGEIFSIDGDIEKTAEANPGGLRRGNFRELISGGFNRLSLGVQSLDDSVLKTLGRIHCATDAIGCCKAAREAGFSNISIDLIYAVPGQRHDSWMSTLEKAIELEPDHISIYELTVEEGTVFGAMTKRGALKLPDEDMALEMYDEAADKLNAAGFEHYEISNFARPGRRSRHNQIYWSYYDYLGLGAGAHSKIGPKRFWNESNPRRYAQMIAKDGCATAGQEDLSAEKALAEALMLGLRMIEGVDLTELSASCGIDPDIVYGKKFEMLQAEGLINRIGHRLKLTRKGLHLSNEAFAEFF